MAAPNNVYWNNPIQLGTRKGMRVIGKLIEEWSLDPSAYPEGAHVEGGGRVIVFPVGAFRKLVAELPEADRLTEGASPFEGDFHIHPNVLEIELVRRAPERLTLVLPDSEAMRHQREKVAAGEMPGLNLATIYHDINRADIEAQLPAHVGDPADGDPATYQVHFSDEDPLDAFLRPYLAAYCCTQCT